jgi:hypothetical protein
VLNFDRSEKSGMYFFNSYDLLVKQGNEQIADVQNFEVHKTGTITLKEGYNLLSGRAVEKTLTNKEGQDYRAWLQLDFRENDQNNNYKTRQYHQNYGFDLEGTLSKYPIKELSNAQEKDHLLRSLKRGNIQKVTFEVEGQSEVRMIEAAPKFKSINIYNSEGRIIIAKTLNQSASQPEKLADTTLTSGKNIQRSKLEGAKPENGDELSTKKASVRKQRRTL